ncbi:MAG TPA: response regulator [Pyrinomonadaceae bacterium]|nr:response regulator [Pyrinomonadaceae bacterium]
MNSSNTVRPAKVLVVEDERHIARLMQFVLQKQGYEVSVAHTGSDALALALEQTPDAVLLDLVLPDISGLEVLRQMRANEKLQAIPMALLSARSFEASETGADDAAVSFHCTKPVAPSTLLRKLLDFGVPPTIEVAPN